MEHQVTWSPRSVTTYVTPMPDKVRVAGGDDDGGERIDLHRTPIDE